MAERYPNDARTHTIALAQNNVRYMAALARGVDRPDAATTADSFADAIHREAERRYDNARSLEGIAEHTRQRIWYSFQVDHRYRALAQLATAFEEPHEVLPLNDESLQVGSLELELERIGRVSIPIRVGPIHPTAEAHVADIYAYTGIKSDALKKELPRTTKTPLGITVYEYIDDINRNLEAVYIPE